MIRTSPPSSTHPSSRARRLWLNLCRLSRLPALFAALWLGLLFCSVPRNANACMPVQYTIYLSVPDNDPVNVTDTLYTSNGQTYVVYNGPIAVYLNYGDDHVYDLNGNIIGYMVPIEDPNP